MITNEFYIQYNTDGAEYDTSSIESNNYTPLFSVEEAIAYHKDNGNPDDFRYYVACIHNYDTDEEIGCFYTEDTFTFNN